MDFLKSKAILIIITVVAVGGAVSYGVINKQTLSPQEQVRAAFTNHLNNKLTSCSGEFAIKGLPAASEMVTVDSIHGSFTCLGDSRDIEDPKARLDLKLEIPFKIRSSEQVSLGAFKTSMIFLDKKFFVNVQEIPVLANTIADVSGVINKWIVIDPEALSAAAGKTTPKFQYNQEAAKKLQAAVAGSDFIRVTTTFSPEAVDGDSSYHYAFIVDQQQMLALFPAYEAFLAEANPANKDTMMVQMENLKKSIAAADQAEFPKGELWIRKSDLSFARIKLDDIMLPNDNYLSVTQPIFSFSISMKPLATPPVIEAPSQPMSLQTLIAVFSAANPDLVGAYTKNKATWPTPVSPKVTPAKSVPTKLFLPAEISVAPLPTAQAPVATVYVSPLIAAGWQEFSPAADNFKIVFPSVPTTEHKDPVSAGLTSNTYTARTSANIIYSVEAGTAQSYLDPSKTLTDVVGRTSYNSGAPIRDSSRNKPGEYPPTEYYEMAHGPYVYKGKVMVIYNRYYNLLATGVSDKFSDTEYQQFLDSFSTQ